MDELTEAQLSDFEARLAALKASLTADLEAATAAARPVELDQARVGRVSRIDAIQQQQMAAASRDAHKLRLALVEQAQGRLERGEYGYCGRCEEPIAPRRLQARPESALCVRCAGGKGR